MPVVPRTSDAGDGTEIASPNVAAKTVVGMVLGILCLFTMVLTYQLIACPHRKRAAARRMPRNALQAAKNTHTPSNTTRSFRTCAKLFGSSNPKTDPANHTPSSSEKRAHPRGPGDGRRTLRALLLPFTQSPSSASEIPPPPQPKPTLLERKGLRALRLNTELLKSDSKQRYPTTPSSMMTPTRKRMGRVFDFGSSPSGTPSSSSTLFSATTPTPTGRRLYKKLDDTLYSDWSNEATYPTERPPEALVSPWSPNERQYPYAPYSPITVRWLSDTPRTPPPLYPPPPAYLPEVPMRSDGLASTPATPTRPGRALRPCANPSTPLASPATASPLVPPVSPIVSRLSAEIDGEIGSWDMPDIRAALASVVTLDRANSDNGDSDMFVIANESDAGDDDDASSELDSVSLHTATDEYESMEPLSL